MEGDRNIDGWQRGKNISYTICIDFSVDDDL